MHRAVVPLVALCLLVAACSDDAESGSSPSTTTEPTASSAPVTTTPDTRATTTPATSPPATTAPTTTVPDESTPTFGAEASSPNPAELQRFLATAPEDDGPFYMVNLVRFREQAEYADGRATDLTGAEADAIYGEWMRNERLPALGAEIVYVATVEDELVAGVTIDQVAVVRYPSRAEFAAMTQDPEFQAMLVHKDAGVAATVAMATSLLPTPELPPVDAPFPATDDDPPFAFVHVFDYRETAQYQDGDAGADDARSGRDAVAEYSTNAGSVAAPLGVRPLAWFEVEAVIIGPVDVWEEVRINWFPSHATFDALTSDPVWESGAHHRTAGLEATYAIRTLPIINTFG